MIISTTVIHSVLILCQAVTINVAINSYSKALFTVMVSNQFVELKGSVFKKFDVKNVFQMSCSGKQSTMYLNYYSISVFLLYTKNPAGSLIYEWLVSK